MFFATLAHTKSSKDNRFTNFAQDESNESTVIVDTLLFISTACNVDRVSQPFLLQLWTQIWILFAIYLQSHITTKAWAKPMSSCNTLVTHGTRSLSTKSPFYILVSSLSDRRASLPRYTVIGQVMRPSTELQAVEQKAVLNESSEIDVK